MKGFRRLAIAHGVVIPKEHSEQVALVGWAKLAEKTIPELRLLYSVPNGGQRDRIVAAKLKAEGVKPGVPDLCLPVARGPYHGLYLEMKRTRGGKVSKDQQRWIADLRAEGYSAVTCKGWDQARETIIAYLALNTRVPSGSILPLSVPL